MKQASHLQLPLCNQGLSLWLSQWLTFIFILLNYPPRCTSFRYYTGKESDVGREKVGKEEYVCKIFSPLVSPLFLASLLHSLVLTLQSLTEEGLKERLVEFRQGWAWKRYIVRSHSSQMQTGAKSVAGGITPMNHAHCDAYQGWEHGKELGTAEPYRLPIRDPAATCCKQPGQPVASALM